MAFSNTTIVSYRALFVKKHFKMLTLPGNPDQHRFITEAFVYAGNLAALAEGMATGGQNTDADQVFKWLFGAEEGTKDMKDMRISVPRTFLA